MRSSSFLYLALALALAAAPLGARAGGDSSDADEYELYDEIDLEASDEASLKLRAAVLSAEVIHRCFGAGEKDPANAAFCVQHERLLREEEKELLEETKLVRALLHAEAAGVSGAVPSSLVVPVPSAKDSEARRRAAEKSLYRESGVRDRSSSALVASAEPEQDSASAVALADLGERVRRHLSTAGIEAANPTENVKLWGKTVKYAFFKHPKQDIGILNADNAVLTLTYADLEASWDKTDATTFMPRDGRSLWPFRNTTHMLNPDYLVHLKPTTAAIEARWRAAVAHVSKHTCLVFEEVVADAPGPKILVIANPSAGGAASHGIGKSVGSHILPRVANGGFHIISVGASVTAGAVVHEIGHALGLGHTQQRADSASYLTHHRGNMDAEWRAQYTVEDAPAEWYATAPDSLAFDFGSIMSYPAWSAAMADATALATATPEQKNANGEIRMLESKVPKSQTGENAVTGPAAKRRGLNEDMDNGGLGQVIAAGQGKLTVMDREIINRAYQCNDKKFKKPDGAVIDPVLAGKTLCECPTTQYRTRATAGKDCLLANSAWSLEVAKKVAQDPAAYEKVKGLVHGTGITGSLYRGLEWVTNSYQALDKLAVDQVVAKLGSKVTEFVGKCRAFCEVQPDYGAAKCWVDARKFKTAIAVDPSKVATKAFSFECGQPVAGFTNFGCFF